MKTSIHVLALVTDGYGARGGIAQYNRDFLGALSELEPVSSVAVLPRHGHERATTLSRKLFQSTPRAHKVTFALAALWAAWNRQVDVVFCGHIFMAPLAFLIARTKKAKLVVQMHGIEAWQRPSRLQQTSVERADLMLSVSRYTRAAVLAWAAMKPERALIVPDTVRNRFTPGDSASLRSELGLKQRRVLLTVGRMSSSEQYKGHERVIRAIPALVARGHDVAYLIVGEGDDRSRLEALARSSGVAERVRFMGGVAVETLLDLYRVADVFVMPSTGEGFGIAYLEAMAAGTPALGLDCAGARDALEGLGEIAPEGELAAVLERMIAVPKPEPWTLTDAVFARFGPRSFAASVQAVAARLLEGS
jgi:phosphatidylinositol alpha-1,6-mannosyltransferase